MTDLGYDPSKFINKKGEVNSYWWDGKPNFGDLIGPYLINKITGKSVVNVRTKRAESAIFSVGSIITMMDRKGSIIWGSGVIGDLNDSQIERLSRVEPVIKAVRGKITKRILEKRIGWEIPNTFGDPALLLPDYFQCKNNDKNNIVVCPHFSHKSQFSGLANTNEIKLIDVADPLESVLTSIASASICVSSSLHGIIVAQAYGVPWVWMYFEGQHLSGSDLKFQDFFSTLDSFENGLYGIPENTIISKELLIKISEQSVLPSLNIDLNALRAAFPII